MALTRTRTAGVAALAALAVVLTACSSGGDSGTDSTAGADGATDAAGAGIAEAQSVGAMADYEVGTTFKATEPVDFSLMYRDHPNYPVKDDWLLFTQLEANQNVTFSRTDIPLSDWDQKKALLIGAGDTTDIISVTYPGQETQFVSGGALLPVSDYFEYMPNFEQKVADWGLQAELDTHKQADGKIYQLPGLREIPDVQYTVAIRDDLWQKAGVTEDPQTWDEFLTDLETVKAANPDLKYAMSDRWTDTTTLGALLNVMSPNFGATAGWGYTNTWFDQDSDEFTFNGTSDDYKELVTYVASLVEAGVLDPEITQSDDQAVQKFVSGQSAAISGNTQVLSEYRTKLADSGNTEATVRLLTIPEGPFGSNLAGSQLSSGLLISSKAAEKPYFKALLQFIDWLYYSDEGIQFAQWGVEGETYTKDGDTRTLNSDIGWNALNPDAPKKLNADFGFSNGVFLLANGSTKDLLQSVMSDEIKEWTNSVLDSKEILPVTPAAGLDEMELEQTSLLDSQLKDAVQAATAGFITGQRSIDDWDSYVTEINGLGAQQLVDTYNTAYQRTATK